MFILSHRGYWKAPEERNSGQAFRRAFALGLGVETDVRDRLGDLVISHDPPTGGEMGLRDLLELHAEYGHVGPLALNIKADGLRGPLESTLADFPKVNAFVFDMSVPDALDYLGWSVPVFTRQSEMERECPFYERASGVWLDAFFGDWYEISCIVEHLQFGKQVCLVSPELHGRDPQPLWDRLAASDALRDSDLMICTDRPEEAEAVFSR